MMVELLYVDTIGYEAGVPRALFTLVDMECVRKFKVAIFGIGFEAYITCKYLKDMNIEVSCFVNNDKKMRGKKI